MPRPLKRFIRPPEPGDFLMLPPRHPLQLWLMVSFVVTGSFQLWGGPEGGTINKAMPLMLFNTSAFMLVFSGLLCLLSAALAKKKPWDSIGLSLAGMIIAGAALTFYLWVYIHAVPAWWTVSGFWFTFALCVGFVHRALELASDAVRLWVWRGK